MIDGIRYYWVRSPISDLPKRFLRTEIFALKANFNLKKKKINIKQKKNQYETKINIKKKNNIKKINQYQKNKVQD